LSETPVHGQPALGVLVSCKTQPDVKLYFEKATGLLIKLAYHGLDSSTKKEVLKEEYFSDYREVRSSSADEETLRAAKIANEPAVLLDYLRKRTLPDADRQRMEASIRKLGDSSFQVREKAKADLLAQGAPAAPLLLQALKDPDPEVANRAKECFDQLGNSPDSSVTSAVIRLLAERRPDGTMEVLLAYLPSAADESVVYEIQAALAQLAHLGGKPAKVLQAALEDKSPLRRAAATQALKRPRGSENDPPGQRITIKGFRRPFKGIQYQDGKKRLEWEFTDVQLFTKLDDSVFTKP